MSSIELSFPVFVALAAVGWADGELHPEESAAILRLAQESGLDAGELSALKAMIAGPVSAERVDFSGLSPVQAAFAYAAASWLSRLDGSISEAEIQVLESLADALTLSPTRRIQVDGISRDVAELPGGERPERYDLRALHRLIGDRLAAGESA